MTLLHKDFKLGSILVNRCWSLSSSCLSLLLCGDHAGEQYSRCGL